MYGKTVRSMATNIREVYGLLFSFQDCYDFSLPSILQREISLSAFSIYCLKGGLLSSCILVFIIRSGMYLMR